MTSNKQRVALLFGGRSAEHDVSLLSAGNVRQALVDAGYDTVLVRIDRDGRWTLADEIAQADDETATPVTMVPGGGGTLICLDGAARSLPPVDVVFPVLHGPFGEDGTMQGFLKLVGVPFVGPGVLGSAIGMDKDASKRLLRDSGIPGAKFLIFTPDDPPTFSGIRQALGLPCFVKPANLGSSIGISKVHDEGEFQAAVAAAFRYDHKILIEQDAEGREIECAVLSADQAIASLPGEIVPAGNHRFYDYDAKYIDDDGAHLFAPADLPASVVAQVQELALRTCRTLDCEGMTRVDFFLKATGELLVNEINTIPGFTAISMYPKLWEASGIAPPQLVTLLIEHALRRFAGEQILQDRRDA